MMNKQQLMNLQQLDSFKADLRRMFDTRIERPIDQINTRLAHMGETLKDHTSRLERLETKIEQNSSALEIHNRAGINLSSPTSQERNRHV